MANFVFVYVAETYASVRSKLIGYLQAGGSTFSNWIAGGIGQQILEATAQSTAGFTDIAAKLARGFASLDSSTDPGDVDPYDPVQQTLTPGPGPLSDLGSNFYGTERIESTDATGVINFANTGIGAVNQSLPPFSFTFQRNYANADGTYPTYRNSGAISALVGQTVLVPIISETPGSSQGATATTVTILVTSLPGVTVTNPAAVVGTDRQDAPSYRETCREAAALTSPNGPADAYRYLAITGRDDGTWGNSTTGNSLGITGVYVSQDSTTGIVNSYYKGASGGAALNGTMPNASGPFQAGVTTFVQAANYLIANTPGVISVPDAMTFIGTAATDVTVNVVFAIKIPASAVAGAVAGTYSYPGTAGSAQAKVFAAADVSLGNFFKTSAIGGDDQIAGAGVIYTEDLRGTLYQIQLTAGINLPVYAVAVTTPAGSTTALALGHDAVYGAATGSALTFT